MVMEIGKFNRLEVVKNVDFGVYLNGGKYGEILLPSRYVPSGCQIGDVLDVFIYLDNEERLVATTLTPLAQVGQFACLKVAWVNRFGAFLDWGLMKDLFVSFREQKVRMNVGEWHVVYVYLDKDSYRIAASSRIEHFLSKDMPSYLPGDPVDVMVWGKTDLGHKAIVDNCYGGLLYRNEVFAPLGIGQRMKAYVKLVRPDGKIDLELQRPGAGKVEDFSSALLQYIKAQGGSVALGDKTPADVVYDIFGVSKKTFKKAIGDLYKKRLILLDDEGIVLAEQGD